MHPISSPHRRTLLQEEDAATAARSFRSPEASFTSTSTSASPFDSSLVLTILILLTALFFIAFFTLYIRRFSSSNSASNSGRELSPPPRLFRNKRGGGGGVNASTVESLPNVPYGGTFESDSKILNECSICLSEFEERELVKVIPYCRHGFHPTCIEIWLSSHVSCPLCRSTQLFPAVDEGRNRNDAV